MKIGTKSLLFGVHLWFWHPLMVAIAWWKLYGFPRDIRLWVAFFVHDWGYWGSPEMDGPQGDLHPHRGAAIMHKLFDRIVIENGVDYECAVVIMRDIFGSTRVIPGTIAPGGLAALETNYQWYSFTLLHSRFLAKQFGAQPSKLCMADKLSLAIEPWWLYLPRAWLSGELKEYMQSAQPGGKHGHMNLPPNATAKQWYLSTQKYLKDYVEKHKHGQPDTTTLAQTGENQ